MNRRPRSAPTLATCALVLCLAAGSLCQAPAQVRADAPAPIQVTNYAPGETIRYPVPLIRGTLADTTLETVTVVNESSTRDTRQMTGLAFRGRFKALAELVPGENRLVIRAGGSELRLTLTYQPQTNPYRVRVLYVTDSSGSTEYQTPLRSDRQDFRGKLDTAAKLMQCFTAECLHDAGLGRRTFNLELDEQGKVQVHVVRGDKTMAEYHKLDGGQLYDEMYKLWPRTLPHPTARNLIIPAFTRFDPATQKTYSHTALGGGQQALFGGGTLYSWPDSLPRAQAAFMDATPVDPTQVLSDSVGRHTFWANASTTIGAALHELGHTFGLPHSTDPQDIMTRGIDRFNRFFTLVEPPDAGRRTSYVFKEDEIGYWAPVSAQFLVATRFFALDDRKWSEDNTIALRLDTAARSVVVSSGNGVRFIGLYQYGRDGVLAVVPLPIPPGAEAPKEVSVPLSRVGRQAIPAEQLGWTVEDAEGLVGGARMSQLLSGPYVTAWHFAATTTPWNDPGAFVPLDAGQLKALEASTAAAPLTRSPGGYVDFLRLAPGERKENVAAYVFRTVKSDRARKVKLLTGSDDALRVWLNEQPVKEVLALRGAEADQDTAEITLPAGESRLLAEVSNGAGGWGLYLRLADEAGQPLELGDDGELRAVDASATRELVSLLRGPFVRRWQFATLTRPWTDHSAFLNLTPEDLNVLQAAALAAPLSADPPQGSYVDFLARFPQTPTDTAAYAARRVRLDRPTRVRLFTGSDDALRVWVNGKPVQQVLKLRGARADSEVAEADLPAGESVLLVEVSNGGGDWGLYLRMEDAQGADLILREDGRLETVR